MSLRITSLVSLPSKRNVEINSQSKFHLHYQLRNQLDSKPSEHSVGQPRIIDEYVQHLSDAYQELTSTNFGWAPKNKDPIDVKIGNLGSRMLGLAAPDRYSEPYMALSSRPHAVNDEIARNKRFHTVVHELTHYFQYQTPVWRYWPDAGKVGKSDPNWWLHEAVALATESLIPYQHQASPSWYTWLHEWVTHPHRSLTLDRSGSFGATFLIYFMNQFHSRFGAQLYSLTENDVPSMEAPDMIDFLSKKEAGIPLATVHQERCMFSDYCTEAGLGTQYGDGLKFLDKEIFQINGQRSRSAIFTEFPISNAAAGDAIQHLGCRYYEFQPQYENKRLLVNLRPLAANDAMSLKAKLIVIPKTENFVETEFLSPSGNNELMAEVPNFDPNEIETVLMVVMNTWYGNGWTNNNDLRYSISARTSR